MNTEHKGFFNDLTETLIRVLRSEDVLVVTPPVQERPHPKDLQSLFSPNGIYKSTSFLDTNFDDYRNNDLVLGTIPMGLRHTPHAELEPISHSLSWDLIYHFSKNLSPDGFGVFLMNPLGFYERDRPSRRNRGREFVNFLEHSDVHVVGFINLPEKILEPVTSLQPMLVVTSRRFTKFKLLDLSSKVGLESVITEFFSDLDQDLEVEQIRLNPVNFRGFRSLEVSRQISSLETRYKDYESIPLEKLTLKLTKGSRDKEFEDKHNTVFFKLLGSNHDLLTRVDQLTGRTDNYIQLELSEKVTSDYLRIFFKSSLGNLILDHVMNSLTYSRIDTDVLMTTPIPVPDLQVQHRLVETHRRLEVLQTEIDQMKHEISINPLSSATSMKVEEMLKISNSLSAGDQIKSLILRGESKTLEFKQTFQYCINSKQKQDRVEISALKTVVGFLNSDGGTLLIGVEDSGLIPGIGLERAKFHKDSNDKLLLHLKDKIKTRLGIRFLPFIDLKVVEVDEVQVMRIDCEPSNEEVFLDGTDFYVRTSPSTDKLEGGDLSKYVKTRFPNV